VENVANLIYLNLNKQTAMRQELKMKRFSLYPDNLRKLGVEKNETFFRFSQSQYLQIKKHTGNQFCFSVNLFHKFAISHVQPGKEKIN
jgi:hypothetical protein